MAATPGRRLLRAPRARSALVWLTKPHSGAALLRHLLASGAPLTHHTLDSAIAQPPGTPDQVTGANRADDQSSVGACGSADRDGGHEDQRMFACSSMCQTAFRASFSMFSKQSSMAANSVKSVCLSAMPSKAVALVIQDVRSSME